MKTKSKPLFDNSTFRQILGCFATGVAVVTAQNDAFGSFGLTINSFTSVSLDPPLVLFCLDKEAALHDIFRKVDGFALNFLSADQQEVSRHFASRHHHTQLKNIWQPQRNSKLAPLLRGTLGWLQCRPYAYYKGGDHTIFVAEVIDLHKRAEPHEPLMYFHGRYRALKPLSKAALGKVTSGARK